MRTIEERPVRVRGIETMQRSSDEMFNATLYLDRYNKCNNGKKSVATFLDDEETKDFIDVLLKEEGLSREEIEATGKKGDVWMCMTLFILFCCWVNPVIRHRVVGLAIDHFDFL